MEALDPPAVFAGGRLRGTILDQNSLFQDVGDFFARLAVKRPILVILEDLHWADPASMDMLRALAPGVLRLPILLIVTYRLDEVTRQHPLYRQLPPLIRESDGLRLNLDRWTPLHCAC